MSDVSLKVGLKSDMLGAIASGLCVIHCLATPFLFVVQSCSVEKSCCSGGPSWWSAIDYLFMGITFFAVYHSSKNTSKHWMKYALYGSWTLLSLLIFNEKFGWIPLSDIWKYLAAFLMISTHLYNLRYCQCKGDTCCVHNHA